MITKTTARLLSIDSLLFFIVLFAGQLFGHAVVISKSLVGSLNFISSAKLGSQYFCAFVSFLNCENTNLNTVTTC